MHRSLERLILLALLSASVIMAGFVIYRGYTKGDTPPVGDEAHYLVITRSLLDDGDIFVANNYLVEQKENRIVTPYPFGPVGEDGHMIGKASIHFPGVSLLAAPAFAIESKTLHVRIFFAVLVTAIFSLATFGFARLFGIELIASAGLGFIPIFAAPFLTSSHMIFPDFISGAFIYLVVYETFHRIIRGRSPAWLHVLALFCLAYLPWLHLKNLLPMFILAAGSVFLPCWKNETSRSNLKFQNLIPILLAFLSLVGIGLFNDYAFDRWQGPYKENSVFASSLEWPLTVFFGLHIDRVQGMFVQNPWFIFGLLGLPLFLRKSFLPAAWVSLLYLSVIVPNALHPCWYGCFTYFGRFWWTVGPLWIIPAVYLISSLGSIQKPFILGSALFSLSWQLLLSEVWYKDKLWNMMWARRDGHVNRLVPESWLPYLPDFGDAVSAASFWPNWAGVAFLVGVLFAGICLTFLEQFKFLRDPFCLKLGFLVPQVHNYRRQTQD